MFSGNLFILADIRLYDIKIKLIKVILYILHITPHRRVAQICPEPYVRMFSHIKDIVEKVTLK